MKRCRFMVLAVCLPLALIGCADKTENKQPAQPTVAEGSAHAFDDRLLEIARSYERYHRVDDTFRIAPESCRAMPSFSSSEDSGTHGRKLYWLYVKELPPAGRRGEYFVAGKPNAVGQALVKEAWLAEEAKVGEGGILVLKDHRFYYPVSKTALFIMFKMDPQTPDTDEGWVYGTVTADGKTVTSAGRVASCIHCHKDAPHDRLFGFPKE